MSEETKTADNVVPIKRSIADEVRGKVALATAQATEADHKAVTELIKKATDAAFSVEIHKLTPGMCGLLFLNWNQHNRSWNPQWSLELERRMRNGMWKRNSMSGGFYNDGKIEDLQHRLAAAALAGYTLELPIVFGIAKDAVDTIDGGKKRSGADHAGLDGIENTARKQQIVKAAAAYLLRAGDASAALKSEAEVKNSIESNNKLLEQAIQIGEQSKAGITNPVLKTSTADMVTYLLLKSGWPLQRIRQKLALFQTGVSTVGENDPFFVASNFIDARRKKSSRGEKLNTTKEIAVVVFAMVEAEKGIKSIQAKHVKAAVDGKLVPSPAYPEVPQTEAAE